MAKILPPPPTGNPNTSSGADGWFLAGPSSSFLNIDKPTGFKPLYQHTDITSPSSLPCKILSSSASSSVPVEVSAEGATVATPNEILVFRYKSHFYAIDHQCPHMQHPLSRAKVYDIEDSVVGVQCPKHRWAFNLSNGESVKRSTVKMRIWDVEVREGSGGEEEVWVRKPTGEE